MWYEFLLKVFEKKITPPSLYAFPLFLFVFLSASAVAGVADNVDEDGFARSAASVEAQGESPEVNFYPNLEIVGTVTDSASGEPLAGVTIQVSGTSTGTVTDENGQYSLNAPDDGVLEVSFVGYNS